MTIPSGITVLWRGKHAQENVESIDSFAFLTLWGWVPSRMNRIPALNLSNRSHTSQDTCLIFKGAAVMQSWICVAGSRTDLIEHVGTDLEWALVPFSFSPAQAHSMKLNPQLWQRSAKGGWGTGGYPGQRRSWRAQKCTVSPFVFSAFILFNRRY